MKIYLASDHAGFQLKEAIKEHLQKEKYQIEDLGTDTPEPANWVYYGSQAAQRISQNPADAKGILICGTGLGMSMVANKFKRVRAALCNDEYSAEMSRLHNDANVLTMGARILAAARAIRIVDLWLKTKFAGGRHQERLTFLEKKVEDINFKS
jgi:ribose 5-phosphate isomerase B